MVQIIHPSLVLPDYPLFEGRQVVVCTGCAEVIPAPRGKGGKVKCPYCDKRFTVVNLFPAGESTRAI